MNYAGVTFSSGNACEGGQVTSLESLFYPDLQKINFWDIFLIMCELSKHQTIKALYIFASELRMYYPKKIVFES